MNRPHLSLRILIMAAVLLAATGCTRTKPSPQGPQAAAAEKHTVPSEKETNALSAPETVPDPTQDACSSGCPDTAKIGTSEHNRANCFHLRPAATVTRTVTKRTTGKTVKKTGGKSPKTTVTAVKTKTGKRQQTTAAKPAAAKKNGKQATPPAPAVQTEVRQITSGICQPQSLIYARCRTGISTCRLGDTSPVQWFACARKSGDTTAIPVPGSVMVLDVNAGRGMPTGHPVYVEEATPRQDGTWSLRISHTNYDRKCHLDLDATVLYNPLRMTASFQSGPWDSWAKDLKALGFILR